MGIEIILAVVTFVATAASTAYQVAQAKKQKAAAAKAAEARKGFEIVIEGEPAYLPIVYGRALVGGTRTWSETTTNFNYVAPNSNQAFLTGGAGQTGQEGTPITVLSEALFTTSQSKLHICLA